MPRRFRQKPTACGSCKPAVDKETCFTETTNANPCESTRIPAEGAVAVPCPRGNVGYALVLSAPLVGLRWTGRSSAFPFFIAPSEGAQHDEDTPRCSNDCRSSRTFDDQKLLAQIIDYYHRTLKETTEGLDYLRSRGITVGEAIDRFRIGYANRTLGLQAADKDSKAGKEIRARLQQLGCLPRHRPRTLQRLRRLPNHGRRWQRSGRGHLRSEDTE